MGTKLVLNGMKELTWRNKETVGDAAAAAGRSSVRPCCFFTHTNSHTQMTNRIIMQFNSVATKCTGVLGCCCCCCWTGCTIIFLRLFFTHFFPRFFSLQFRLPFRPQQIILLFPSFSHAAKCDSAAVVWSLPTTLSLCFSCPISACLSVSVSVCLLV